MSKDSQTATLAYISHNHVGFRRVTIKRLWNSGQMPGISVEENDSSSVCIALSTDAFVEWENTASTLINSRRFSTSSNPLKDVERKVFSNWQGHHCNTACCAAF